MQLLRAAWETPAASLQRQQEAVLAGPRQGGQPYGWCRWQPRQDVGQAEGGRFCGAGSPGLTAACRVAQNQFAHFLLAPCGFPKASQSFSPASQRQGLRKDEGPQSAQGGGQPLLPAPSSPLSSPFHQARGGRLGPSEGFLQGPGLEPLSPGDFLLGPSDLSQSSCGPRGRDS